MLGKAASKVIASWEAAHASISDGDMELCLNGKATCTNHQVPQGQHTPSETLPHLIARKHATSCPRRARLWCGQQDGCADAVTPSFALQGCASVPFSIVDDLMRRIDLGQVPTPASSILEGPELRLKSWS